MQSRNLTAYMGSARGIFRMHCAQQWQEVDFDNLGNEKMLIFDRLGIKCVYLQAKCKALPSNLFCEIKNCKKRCASFLLLKT